jgi:hypothetical protein
MQVRNINKLTIAALNAAATFQQRVADIRAALPAATLADKTVCADALRPGVAQYYGIKLDPKGTGRLVFPAAHADSETARRALSRLVAAVIGAESSKASDDVEIPAELLAAARKLAKLANQYEGARKLASKALAAAFAA